MKLKNDDDRIVWELLALEIRLVPEWGQAPTVQGEMVRAIRQLQFACAFRSIGLPVEGGNDQTFASYLRHHLSTGNVFAGETLRQIEQDLELLAGDAHPGEINQQAGKDALFRMRARVVDWCRHHPRPLPREVTADIACAR